VAAPPVVSYVCPRCRGPLAEWPAAWACEKCRTSYPIVAGIPDFRVAPDPWIGLEEDRVKALRLDERTREMDFEAAVREYWAITPSTPAPQAERFVRHVLGAADRSRQWLAAADAEDGPAPDGPWLDLGCGTADLAAAAPPEVAVVGVDIALRWLVVARKRPGALGPRRALVCACAEALPFPDATFARALSLGMLEHAGDAQAAVAEARRILRPRGVLRLRTLNRYTPLREPHVNVWGVGFVPRRWADAYVRWRSGQRYLFHRPLSPRELAATLRRAGLARAEVAAARLLPAERTHLGRLAEPLAGLTDRLRRAPLARAALAWTCHLLEARGEAP
jgi:ubiquinone/menaquinone biosynthesis C-methylase UbiE/uncharacterized protein YbaR (Trm112 family)